MTDTRWCPHCQAERPLTEFYPNRAAASGFDGYCKEYRKEKRRQYARDQRTARHERLVAQGIEPSRKRSPHRIDNNGRECIGCKLYKPWPEYHLDRASSTGHQTKCKACIRQRQAIASTTEEGRAAARRRTAEYRERTRGPDWVPKQVTRHAQLQCDGLQHRCSHCGVIKPVTEFPHNKDTPCGFDPNCKACRHGRRVERRTSNHNDILTKELLAWAIARFGITVDDYFWLLSQQSGGCALCGEPESQGLTFAQGKKRLSVDHDHDHCGLQRACKECIRGLLCHRCNVGLGMFEGKVATRGRFADYLEGRPFHPPSLRN